MRLFRTFIVVRMVLQWAAVAAAAATCPKFCLRGDLTFGVTVNL